MIESRLYGSLVTMKTLQDLLSDTIIISGQEKLTQTITKITSSSKQIDNNSLFIAEKGIRHDGHQFISEAINKKAAAIVLENDSIVVSKYTGVIAKVPSTRKFICELASRFYNYPSSKLFCVGVTGTNGKTSTTYIIEWLLNQNQISTGVIGTINHHLKDKMWETTHTTPDPISLQERLNEFVNEGAKALAIEVSSHALDQFRVNELQFDVAIFTNLTRDHLDYHITMENYFASKNKLFSDLLPQSKKQRKAAFLNGDDPWVQKVEVPVKISKYFFGQNPKHDLYFEILSMEFGFTKFKLISPWGTEIFKSPLVGLHNVYNVVGAIGACLFKGIKITTIKKNLESFTGIPGRLQLVLNTSAQKQKFIFIDYAHTPDALENVLKSLVKLKTKSHLNSKIITVFGCGGDRDKGKRPLMAAIAETYSDHVIVTSDNPRTEEPIKIIEEIEIGFKDKNYDSIENRKLAIQHALKISNINDVVLIAGKGHETYQIIGKEKFYFNDYELAWELYNE